MTAPVTPPRHLTAVGMLRQARERLRRDLVAGLPLTTAQAADARREMAEIARAIGEHEDARRVREGRRG